MDAVSLINQNLNVRTIIEHYNLEGMKGDGLIRAYCPLHNSSHGAFVINEENGYWTCHSNCGNGDIYSLVMKLENTSFPNAIKIIASLLDLSITGLPVIHTKPPYLTDTQKWMRFINKQPSVFEPYVLPACKRVTKYKDFQKETLHHFDVRFIEEFCYVNKKDKDITLRNRLLIPLYFENQIIGCSLRRTCASDAPKWFHMPLDIKVGTLLFNYDQLRPTESIIVVEGITDVWRFYEAGLTNCVACFGAHLTLAQERLLLLTGCDITLCYDNDEAGNKATEKAISHLRYKANLSKIELPLSKDPGDCNSDLLKSLYNQRKKV